MLETLCPDYDRRSGKLVRMEVEASKLEIRETRHILGLSGGKDSAALATYLKDQGRDGNIEYFFCDTGSRTPRGL